MIPMNEIKIQGSLLFPNISKNTKIAAQCGTPPSRQPGHIPHTHQPPVTSRRRMGFECLSPLKRQTPASHYTGVPEFSDGSQFAG